MNIHNISVQELAQLGMRQLAYLRPVSVEGNACVAIHAADGTPLALAGDLNQALQAIIQHEMVPVSVH
jgi:hypothetical protein